YLLQVMNFPPAAAQGMAGPNGLKTFMTGMKSSLTQSGSALESEADTTLGGKPGKLVVARNPALGKGAVTSLTVVGSKAFVLSVFGGAALKGDDATARQFFEKFELK